MRRNAPALARFAALLDSHRKAREFSYAALARALPSPRDVDGRAAANTVSNWCKGTALPTEIEPLLRALFGQDRSRNAEPREAMRAAFEAACAERHGAIIARAKPNPAGSNWVVDDGDERFVLDPTARPTDQRAAADPLRQQLQGAIRTMAAELAEACGRDARGRFDNSANWKHLPSAAHDFRAVVEREPREIPGLLGEAYPLMLRLGRFLETDHEVRMSEPDEALDANTRGLLGDLVRTAAPWLRGFPTVAKWDDDAGKLLVRAALLRETREFVTVARNRRMIGQSDAERIGMLAEDAEADGDLARKEGHRAVADTNNLILAIAGLMAAALAGATPPARADLARRASATLADTQAQVAAFSAAQQPDLRQALQELAAQGRRLAQVGPAVLPAAPVPPVTADVEKQARDMILRGEAPPAHWRPAIGQLSFNDTALDSLLGLSDLTWLRRLGLARTQIADLGPLSRLIGLKFLDLDHTPASDISALASLTELETLRLWGTQVRDVAPLARLISLRFLDLQRTSVSDLSPLAGLTGLQHLELKDTQVSDLSILAGLIGLQTLDLRYSQVSDLSGLAGLTGLQTLDLCYTQVSDLSVLAGLTGLQSLDLSFTQVTDLTPLAGLTGLQTLNLGRTRGSDLSGLTRLTGLQTLDLRYTQVSDLSGLAGLTGLQSLYLDGTQVSDLSGLTGLTGLHILYLRGMQLSDLSGLAGLTGLRRLYFDEERTVDVSPLANLNDLEIIRLPWREAADSSGDDA